jgi:glutaminyl-peptide cyclotransferase
MQRVLPVVLIPLLFSACTRGRDIRPEAPNSDTTRSGGVTTSSEAVTIPAFNGRRAFDFLTDQTAFGPRNPNSKGHAECLSYLTTRLRECTNDVRLQEFTHEGYDAERLVLTNIIASFHQEAGTRILLCAHWDTRPRADQDENEEFRRKPILGANDGASGVAVLLEIAAILSSNPPPVGVDIVLFDGEDYGREGDHANYLLGSRYFASVIPTTNQPKFGILLDMVGDKTLDLPREQNSVRYAPDIVNLVWNTAARLGIRQFENIPGEEIMDDHLPLNQVGIKAIDIIDFNYPDNTNRFWHTLQDTPDHCSSESLEAVGTVLVHVIYEHNF